MVERWFRKITDKRIRRGTFRNGSALIAAIEEYLNNHNSPAATALHGHLILVPGPIFRESGGAVPD